MSETLAVLIVLLVVVVWIYNLLIKDRNQVLAAWSDIDVQLKRRHDLIPQLVTAVRAYSEHEKATMLAVTELRNRSEVTEQDDLNLKNPPDRIPDLFESYLPFALALGVERAWAEQFTDMFAKLEIGQGRGYRPVWYSGAFHNNLGEFTTDIGANFNTAISAASTAPALGAGDSPAVVVAVEAAGSR